MTSFVEVILPLPLSQTFTYSVPEEYAPLIQSGLRVLVPFREKTLTGVILSPVEGPPERIKSIRPILSVLDEAPLFSPSFLGFIFDLSRLSLTAVGELLKAAVPPEFLIKEKGGYKRLKMPTSEEIRLRFRKKFKEAEKIIGCLSEKKPHTWRFLCRQTQMNYPGLMALLSRMEKLGWACQEKRLQLPQRGKKASPPPGATQLSLGFPVTSELEPALNQVLEALFSQEFKPFLLLGSQGQREAFFLTLLNKWGAAAGNVLILTPDILGATTCGEKMVKIFGPKRVALLHAELASAKREATWQRIFRGEADIVVGPRSAVFAPLSKVRLIWITEESDEGYGHLEPAYDAREAAWLRAKQEGAVILYGSSAPSVGLYARAKERGFLLPLGEASLAPVRIVTSPSTGGKILSPEVREAIEQRLSRKEKIVIFLNRRGYASLIACPRCGQIALCPHCRRPLTLYVSRGKAVCHQCHYEEARWLKCPRCGSSGIEYRGHGLERVAEEIRRFWPQVRLSSLEAESAKGKKRRSAALKDWLSGRLDILIGTQFLLSSPGGTNLSLVVILYPEMMLAQADFRSGERVFQLIRRLQDEMASSSKSELLIQTAAPENYVFKALAKGGYEQFAAAELRFRRLLGLPPWQGLIQLTLSGQSLRGLARQARSLKEELEFSGERAEVLGPTVLPRMRRKNQVQILIKGKEREELVSRVYNLLKKKRVNYSAQVFY